MSDFEKHAPPDPRKLSALRRYLDATGWSRRRLDSGLDLFTTSVDSVDVEIVLPPSAATLGWPDAVKYALTTLTYVEDRSVPEIERTLETLDYDVMSIRLPDSSVLLGSITLKLADKVLSEFRTFLISAASAELSGAVEVPHPTAASVRYANECRLGHTFQGSFGFRIESPVGPGPVGSPRMQASPPPPFQRRVVERVARGLSALGRATAVGVPVPLVEARDGFNANMCDAFASLLEGVDVPRIAVEVGFSPNWQTAKGVPSEIVTEIPGALGSIVLRASAAAMRKAPDPETVRIVGTVVRLQSKENPADLLHPIGSREIAIQSSQDDKNINVRLPPEDYLRAVDAHARGALVTVTGTLDRASRGPLTLTDPTDFNVVGT